jgi:hypothetical protein
MPKKIILIITLLLTNHLSFAETCPSIADIKHHTLPGWQVYDSDDGTPLSTSRAQAFKNEAQQFALAESASNDGKHRVHCYYHDNNGSAMEAYLGKESFTPFNHKNYWYKVSGAMQCAAGMKECEFQTNVLKQPQLATN